MMPAMASSPPPSVSPSVSSDPEATAALFALRELVDEALENALVARSGIAELMDTLLPVLVERMKLRGIFLRTYAEDLALHDFSAGETIAEVGRVLEACKEGGQEEIAFEAGGRQVIGQPLDVVGCWFGTFAISVEATDPRSRSYLARSANLVCEVLDNFLYAIRASREKHTITMELGDALRERVLGEGLGKAAAILHREIPISRMLLVYTAEEAAESTLQAQLYQEGKLVFDTLGAATGSSFAPLRMMAQEYLASQSTRLLEEVGMLGAQEEILINGITHSVVVGKVLVMPKGPPFNTHNREILSSFAGYIRQRIVDFNKEWRNLASSFSQADVARLLSSEDYRASYLEPREAEVAMLYVDIAGFTRLSEQVLKTPAQVAQLVEIWSKDAVDIVWQHGGVFDKMVGDCIIALFGPPFYETPPGARLASAIACAVEIREMTENLPKRPALGHLAEVGVGVSTGVNLAPLFVGTFGPNSNFTGFSSGMNNTARLQGCAKNGEILVMQEAIARLPEGHGFVFGEEQKAQVKNVAEPLRYRGLVRR